MVASIRTIDTAFSTFRTFLSASVITAPSSSTSSSSLSSPFVYHASQQVAPLSPSSTSSSTTASLSQTTLTPSRAPLENETTNRLKRIQHSSVSQNISQLLLFSTSQSTDSLTRTGKISEMVRQGGEIGAKELARAGLVGIASNESRRYELSL